MSKLTFLDSGVLIAAARGADEVARLAMTVLDDPDRTFASSALVRLEVLPKALRHHRESEARFYETFFQSVSAWASIGDPLAEEAFLQARNFDLHAMVLIPMKVIIDSDMIPVTGSEVKLIVFGAKRRWRSYPA